MAQLFKNSMQTVMKSRSKSNLSERMASVLEVNIEKQMTIIENIIVFLLQLAQLHPL